MNETTPKVDPQVIDRVINLMKSPPTGGKVAGSETDALSSLAIFVIQAMTREIETRGSLYVGQDGRINESAVNNTVASLVNLYTTIAYSLVNNALETFNKLNSLKK